MKMANLAHIHEVYKVDRDAADGVQHGYDLAPLAAGHQAPIPAVCDVGITSTEGKYSAKYHKSIFCSLPDHRNY